ncbi:hypothetical protein VHEMI06880 [[Torrubiella] hemipterigena]|uniref:Pre-rRNA-processing protein TSR2 n=1 Tax=[Torrubiella] hemipterigena TaxID=1531966 RepID=A0A0A1TLX6_9HYPO|nr:hypothetical protein VHEMI06880 [[Torrubiella] hemipterigena]
MDTTIDLANLPPAADRQSNFEQGVACAMNLWPALTLSVQNKWGGDDSADKRDWFTGAIVDLFPEFTDDANAKSAQEADVEDVETVLLQVMMDEFDVNVDDDSAYELALQIIRIRMQCTVGEYTEVKELQQRFASKTGKVDQLFKKAEDPDQDTDAEPDDSAAESDDDDDVNMDEAPALVPTRKEKPAPQVDEDGFTMVTKKR